MAECFFRGTLTGRGEKYEVLHDTLEGRGVFTIFLSSPFEIVRLLKKMYIIHH